MAFINVNRVKYFFRVDGDPAAPALVLSNSLGTDHRMWDGQLEAFTPHFRVIRYDTRGHGHSEAPAGSYTIDQLAGDVIGLLDHVGIDRAHFCGISMGGLTGAALAGALPGVLLSALVWVHRGDLVDHRAKDRAAAAARGGPAFPDGVRKKTAR